MLAQTLIAIIDIGKLTKPYMTCRVLGSCSGQDLCERINSIILCSPSPGTVASEMMILSYNPLVKVSNDDQDVLPTFSQAGSVLSL